MPLAVMSCGRVGYDELLILPGGGAAEGGQGGSGRDGGSSPAGAGGAMGASGGSGTGASSNGGAAGNGGVTSAGGTTSTGGATSSAGTTSTGGDTSNGGTTSTGGVSSTGGVTSTGGVASTGGVTSTGGAGGVGSVGCADGQREGFLDTATYPDIAACDGGFALPGIIGLTGPACARAAGDDGSFPDGTGCNAMDLCAAGFHLCAHYTEIAAKSPTGCLGAAAGATPVFYAAAQPGAGQAKCATAGATGTDDVYGCGTMGAVPNIVCAPIDAWSGNTCKDLTLPWSCPGSQGSEALSLVKPGSIGGGVLCCRD